MLELNQTMTIKNLMDSMGVDLKHYDNHKVIKRNQGVLKANPYFLVDSLEDLQPQKDHHLHGKLSDSIIEKDAVHGQKPVTVSVIMMPFNFVPGSKESLDFLRVLRSKGKSHLYLSETAQAIVNYKNL